MWNLLLDSMQNKNEDGNTTQEQEDGLSDNFDFNERNYKKEGEDTLVNYFYQLPLAPSSSEVPLAPILGTSPKLNLKLNLEFNHVLEAPTTMQSYCISGDENASLKPTHDENTPPRLTHFGIKFYAQARECSSYFSTINVHDLRLHKRGCQRQ